MRTSEQNFRKKKYSEKYGEFMRNDARPSQESVDNARNRTAIIVSGRLSEHETGRNTWEHSFTSS